MQKYCCACSNRSSVADKVSFHRYVLI